MKKDELIKLGCDEETAKKVESAVTEELKGFIAKARFDEVNGEKKTLEATLKDRDSQLETLKNSTGDVEGLKNQIAELQTANKTADEAHAAEIKTLKINAAVDAALTASKAKNAKAVKALLDLDKAELSEDGTIKGLDDQIKKLVGADDSKFLFDTEQKQTKMKGAQPAQTGKEEPDTKVDVSKMSYEELAAYMEANPEANI
jgi:DNA repair exonuclease SbcCD ATPase subunit